MTQLEIDQTDFSNVDEPAMSLGIESWRNMVGGGTGSGLRAMLRKGSLEVLLLGSFSCVQLCDLIDGSSPDSPIPGIFQVRTLEWGAIAFSA